MTPQWTEAGLARLMNDVKKENGMDNDRELLEMAAKAAGIELGWKDDRAYIGLGSYMPGHWNPLTDDGDVLRLAVRLGLDVQVRRPETEVWVCPPADDMPLVCERFGGDEYAATRRAIVRAAAAIGRAMP